VKEDILKRNSLFLGERSRENSQEDTNGGRSKEAQ
jgi:hypothetical protein